MHNNSTLMIILEDNRLQLVSLLIRKKKDFVWLTHVYAISQFFEKNIQASLRKSEDSMREIASKRIVSIIHRSQQRFRCSGILIDPWMQGQGNKLTMKVVHLFDCPCYKIGAGEKIVHRLCLPSYDKGKGQSGKSVVRAYLISASLQCRFVTVALKSTYSQTYSQISVYVYTHLFILTLAFERICQRGAEGKPGV